MGRPPLSDDREARVPGLLARLRNGDASALDELFPILYDQLHGLAARQRAGWEGNETLDTTALLHEAYLKLARQESLDFRDRPHFLRAAARTMRHILVNYAERARADKRGGGRIPVQLGEVQSRVGAVAGDGPDDLELIVELDRLLDRLESRQARQARIVECRVFGGMTIDETAEALDVSPATVSRGWAMAQAWLRRELVGTAS